LNPAFRWRTWWFATRSARRRARPHRRRVRAS
jgi:hypothetical protein